MNAPHTITKSASDTLKVARAGADKLAQVKLAQGMPPLLEVTSDWFPDGGTLPVRCTADGQGGAPPLGWTRPPVETQSVALVCEDPDAPMPEPFVHWLVYAIPADLQRLDLTTLPRARQGQNSNLKVGFTPAAPPPGHGIHHYHFQLFALDVRIHLEHGVGRAKLLEAMRGHVLQWGRLVGQYQRS